MLIKFESNTFLDFIDGESIKTKPEVKNLKEEIKTKPEVKNLKEEINNFISKGLNELEIKIFDLENYIKDLKKTINEMKENMKNELEKLRNELTNTSYNIIKEKFQIYEKKMKLNINELELKIPSPKEQLISIIFTSLDENIYYSIICKKTDSFSKIESLFYEKYPQYKKYKRIFIVNGNTVDVSRNVEENNIKNSDVILVKKQTLI